MTTDFEPDGVDQHGRQGGGTDHGRETQFAIAGQSATGKKHWKRWSR
jgi:hypothetical protein